jgi:hypothetical protein
LHNRFPPRKKQSVELPGDMRLHLLCYEVKLPDAVLEWRGTKWFPRNSHLINSNNENDISLERCQQGTSFLYLTFVPNPYGLKLILEVLKLCFRCSLRYDGLNLMG